MYGALRHKGYRFLPVSVQAFAEIAISRFCQSGKNAATADAATSSCGRRWILTPTAKNSSATLPVNSAQRWRKGSSYSG